MTERPTLGRIRQKRMLAAVPYRPRPLFPVMVVRPIDGSDPLMQPCTTGDRRALLEFLSWSVAVDAARTIDSLVNVGWPPDEAADLYRAALTALVDDAVSFAAGWCEVTE